MLNLMSSFYKMSLYKKADHQSGSAANTWCCMSCSIKWMEWVFTPHGGGGGGSSLTWMQLFQVSPHICKPLSSHQEIPPGAPGDLGSNCGDEGLQKLWEVEQSGLTSCSQTLVESLEQWGCSLCTSTGLWKHRSSTLAPVWCHVDARRVFQVKFKRPWCFCSERHLIQLFAMISVGFL